MSNHEDASNDAHASRAPLSATDSLLDVAQNLEGVPYAGMPFSHIDWSAAGIGSASILKQDSNANGHHRHHHHHHHHMVGDDNPLDDEYSIEQDLSLKNISGGDPSGSPAAYINDRQRIQIHNQLSWEEAIKQDVLIVRCRDTTAELHKSRLGSGSKGKCIKVGDSWYTPTEFETRSGRGSSKDWKRSIRFGGHTLQKLIEEGILAPHAISCTCSICCGDSTLTGPVRLFQPYRRKRRDVDHASRSGSMERTRRPVDMMPPNNINPMNMIQSNSYTFDHVDEMLNLTLNATQQLKIAWDQVKMQTEAVREAAISQARIQGEMEKREALSQQRLEVLSILKRLLPAEQESLLQQIIPQLHMDNIPSAKSCSNCGRDAYLECTACRQSWYCSTYCQQKDWPQHQHSCVQMNDHHVHQESIEE